MSNPVPGSSVVRVVLLVVGTVAVVVLLALAGLYYYGDTHLGPSVKAPHQPVTYRGDDHGTVPAKSF